MWPTQHDNKKPGQHYIPFWHRPNCPPLRWPGPARRRCARCSSACSRAAPPYCSTPGAGHAHEAGARRAGRRLCCTGGQRARRAARPRGRKHGDGLSRHCQPRSGSGALILNDRGPNAGVLRPRGPPPRSFDASSMDDWCLSGNGPRASVSKIFGPGAEVLQGIKWLRHAAWADTTRGSGPEARFTHHSNAPRRYFDRIAAAAGVAFGLRCDRESRLCIETSKPPCLRPFPSLGAGSTPTRSSCGSACRSRTWWEATENRSVLGSAAPLARSNPDTRTRREGFRRAAHLWSPCPTCCHAHCRIGLRVARADRGRR